MNPESNEDFDNPNPDPHREEHVDFDWPTLERMLGEDCPVSEEELRKYLSIIMRAILAFVTKNIDMRRKDALKHVGCNCVGLSWVVDPKLFNGCPTAIKLAKHIGVDKRTFSKITAEVTRHFGIRNRMQANYLNQERNLSKRKGEAKERDLNSPHPPNKESFFCPVTPEVPKDPEHRSPTGNN